MKTSDVADDLILTAMAAIEHPRWWAVAERLPAVPPKVVLSKMRKMVERGVLASECTCGCGSVYRAA